MNAIKVESKLRVFIPSLGTTEDTDKHSHTSEGGPVQCFDRWRRDRAVSYKRAVILSDHRTQPIRRCASIITILLPIVKKC